MVVFEIFRNKFASFPESYIQMIQEQIEKLLKKQPPITKGY
jgi:hypothetical protein